MAASFPPPAAAGSAQYLSHIVSHLPPHSVVVQTGNAEPAQAELFDRGLPQRVVRHKFIIHVANGYKAGKLRRLLEYVRWPAAAFWLILREAPQVVHVGEHNVAGLAALAANKILGIPYMMYTYAEEVTYLSHRPIHNFLYCRLLRQAAAVITVSEYTRGLLIERGVQPQRIHKILPTVGTEKLAVAGRDEVENVRNRYGLQGKRVVLTVGRLVTRKGHASMVEALPQILRRFPETRYVIVGKGPEEETLRRQVSQAGLQDSVRLLGLVDDRELACLYQMSDVFVMPHRFLPETSDTEGCPTVFLEASAHGKPVIGGNAGGVSDAILDGKTGFIIDGTSAQQIADTVCRLLQDPALAADMGRAGREYVAGLTPERAAEMILRINESITRLRH